MNRYEKAVKRWFGRIFIRNDRDGKGFQMLVYGCFWMHVEEGDWSKMETKRIDQYVGLECFDDCSILWNDFTTIGMPRAF